jgi:hypothetical protein
MNDWTRSDTIEGNGYYWYDADNDVSVFEDTSEGTSQFYAWRGQFDSHDTAQQTTVYPTFDEAVAALGGD